MKKHFWLSLMAASLLIGALTTGAVAEILDTRGRPVLLDVPGRSGVTLVIDPGHGGADGGAVSVTGTFESALNLDIALKARELAGLFGVKCVMTRETQDIQYPENANTIRAKKVFDTHGRAQFVETIDNAVLLSIHQNKYTTSGPSGCQVFYATTQGSAELAQGIQDTLRQLSEKNGRGAVQIGKDVYIMNHVSCPAVLVECGFVSNYAEAALLETPEYQLKLAALIVGSCIAGIS